MADVLFESLRARRTHGGRESSRYYVVEYVTFYRRIDMKKEAVVLLSAVLCASLCLAAEQAPPVAKSKPIGGKTADEFLAKFIASNKKGYIARPCGFDMNRDGILGAPPDRLIGDGKTADPDGDGVDEDILYVDSKEGNDLTGDGSPAKPFKTIQKALDSADGPDDGAEDIICISGIFHEKLTIRKGGVPGHYLRDKFQFPNNPAMLVGWDKDGDGQYPPFDKDDVAVLDGQGKFDWAIRNARKNSFLEIAHLTIRNYGDNSKGCGAFQLFANGRGNQSHIYIHDVELHQINKAIKGASNTIVFSFWGGPREDIAFINNLVNEFAGYFCRGSPRGARFRFQNNTFIMHGPAIDSPMVTTWKIWGMNSGMEILDNVVDGNPRAYGPKAHVTGALAGQCTQGWVVKGNVFKDLLGSVVLQAHAGTYCIHRNVHDILIDSNFICNTYDGWRYGPIGISMGGCDNLTNTVEDVTVTNNIFWTNAKKGFQAAMRINVGNNEGPQPGEIRIAGNTMYGPFTRRGTGAIIIDSRYKFNQNNITFKNNIIANAGVNPVIKAKYAPSNFAASGNVYDGATGWVWNGVRVSTLSEWQTATKQDAESRTGTPKFVDAAKGDLHLHPKDTVARGAGVDITKITKVDFDGEGRSATNAPAGADAPRAKPPSSVSKP